MNAFRKEHIPHIRDAYGIVFDGAGAVRDVVAERRWAAASFAMDAAPTYALQAQMVTTVNAGIPAYLTNYMDPELVRVLTTPLKAEEILPAKKYGDWTTLTAQFPIIESNGDVSSYGDFNNNGQVGVNVDFVPRQSYHFQTFTRWGDQQLDRMGLAKIDFAAEQNVASAKVINIALNKGWMYGYTGLDNYGILNDPSLSAYLTPATKAATGTTWAAATGKEVYADVQALFVQLQKQLGGNLDMGAPMKLVCSPAIQPNLLKPMDNVYGTSSVEDFLKKAMPKLQVVAAMEYDTTSGQVVQLIADEVQGQKTGWVGFTERMRAHAIVRETSSTHQKKSAGIWGAIIKFPAAFAQGIGY
jgi:hypothetical protein